MPITDLPTGPIDLLAVGEALIDFISEQPTDNLGDADTFRRHLGGSPANIAVYVAKLGGTPALIAKTGIGAFGTFLKAQLQAAGVITDYLVMDHRVHTSVVFISRTDSSPDFEALRAGDAQLQPNEIPEAAVRRARVVHASTFALSRPPSRQAVQRAFDLARRHQKLISLDPNYSPVVWPEHEEARAIVGSMLGYATLTKPSLDDCHRFFGDEADPLDYLERFHEFGPRVVVLTMGRDGILLSDDGRITHIPVRPVEVVDVTGAGDSFWAGFLIALLDGIPLDRCVLFGREVVERKLATVGMIPGTIDRHAIYASLAER